MTLEQNLIKAEAEVKRIKQEIKTRDEDPLPVGSIIRLSGSGAIAARFASWHSSLATYNRQTTKQPVWVELFSDGSGSSAPTLKALLASHKTKHNGGSYTLIHKGTGEFNEKPKAVYLNSLLTNYPYGPNYPYRTARSVAVDPIVDALLGGLKP